MTTKRPDARTGVVVALCAAIGLTACDASNPRGRGESRTMTVVAAPVEIGDFVVTTRVSGDVVADVADVAAETQGRLIRVAARIGDRVERGQLLAAIDAEPLRLQLAAAEARLAAARADLGPAKSELERSSPLVAQGLMSNQNLEEMQARVAAIDASAQAARAEVGLLSRRVDDATIRAPVAGVVAARYKDEGTFVNVGTPLFRIVGSDRLFARLRVPEALIARLAPGAAVSLEAVGIAEAKSATVIGVSGEIDAVDRSAWAEVAIDDPAGLQHGMYTRATIDLARLEGVAIVPLPAVVERVDGARIGTGVFTVDAGLAKWIPVEVLAQDIQRAAIAGALTAGMPVLVQGHLALSDGAAVELAGGSRDATVATEAGITERSRP